MTVVWRQALRLGIILLVCAGIAVVTSTFLQTPLGNAALSSLVRRGGPDGFQGAPNAGAAPQRVRGAAPQAADASVPNAGVQNVGPRDGGGGRLTPNIKAGLPEVLRSAGMMGLLATVVALALRRKPRPHPAPARVARASRPDSARAA